jgi:hypothetical protein
MPPALSFDHNGGVGFRFQMGEWVGKPNYLLQTGRNLKWYRLIFSTRGYLHYLPYCRINLPPDLLALCDSDAVQASTVRHFALGPEGKWYFEHVRDGELICSTCTVKDSKPIQEF